jgi:hypothetical protein
MSTTIINTDVNNFSPISYIARIFIGVLLLFMCEEYSFAYLYSASSSDHTILIEITSYGSILVALTIGYTLSWLKIVLVNLRSSTSLWQRGIVALWLTILLTYTLLNLALVGVNLVRAADGLLAQDHQAMIHVLDD